MVELLFALVLLAIGVLAVGQMFPIGSRAQNRNRMLSTGNYYAQDKLEELRALAWEDAALSDGRHPAGTATEALGDTGAWQRYYQVTQLAAPMDNLRKVSVVVRWTTTRTDSVSATTSLSRVSWLLVTAITALPWVSVAN
jgi:phosphatidylinositol kinase/protein kinase (PI-3  family)